MYKLLYFFVHFARFGKNVIFIKKKIKYNIKKFVVKRHTT